MKPDIDQYCLQETLKFVVQRNAKEIVRELIHAGADVNMKNILKQTPLMFAAQNNHTEIVQELIKAGAIVNLKSDRHETALLLAH